MIKLMKMKKWLCWALALALSLSAGALAAGGNANLALNNETYEEYGDGVYGIFVKDGELYLYGNRHVYTWSGSGRELDAVEFEPPEVGEGEERNLARMFSDGERVWALYGVYQTSETEYSLKRLELMDVQIGADGVTFGEPRALACEGLTASYGGDSVYLAQINDCCCVDGVAYMLIYDEDGGGQLRVYALDLERGEGDFLDVENACQITPYGDDRLLIETSDYNARTCEFLIWDNESESLTPACDPVEAERGFYGIAYSAESGKLFYADDGYLKAAQDFDFEAAEPVAELYNAGYSETAGALLSGERYVCFNWEATCVRSTNPDALPETRLVVSSGYSQAVIDAYNDFTAGRDDVAVIMSNDYIEDSKIIESMLNRDSDIDIYLLSVQSQAYDALYERGYLAELENADIRAAVEKMYPGVRAALEKDGALVAVPVSVYGWAVGVDREGFEKIGVSAQELPTDWLGFLELLEELPDKLPDDGSVRIFDDYMTQNGCREQLLAQILQTHVLYTGSGDVDPAFDTPAMQAVLDKVMALDYAALGLKEDDEDEGSYGGGSVIVGGDPASGRYTLVQLSVGCTLGNFYGDNDPLLLSVDPDAPAQLPLELTVVCVNPFSKHVELAQEFVAEVARHMESGAKYSLSDECNEPLRSAYYAQNLKSYEESLENLRKQVEAAEPVDKPVLEEQLKSLEDSRAELEKYSWEINQESLDWYRAHADNLAVYRYNPLYSAESGGELYQLLEQLVEGRIDAAAFLKGVDQKVRMMILEGN